MSDTITRLVPRHMSVREQLWNGVMEAICRRYGHKMRDYGRELPFGKREYCVRCEANRVTLTEAGTEVWASKAETMALEPRLGEAIYEARWGDVPRQRFWRGQWPSV